MSEAIQNVAFKFICGSCDYKTNKKYDFNKHLLTAKHLERQNAINKSPTQEIRCHCNKTFKHYSSLYRHKKKCINTEEFIPQNTKNTPLNSQNTIKV